MAGARISYVHLSMVQVIRGLRSAFPLARRKALPTSPRLRALRDRVLSRPRIVRYPDSGRRVAFDEDGIFRRYPELDG
jgi:glutathione S-transferase